MAEGQPTQYAFTHGQVITQLIHAAGIHDGLWALTVQFGLGMGAFATGPGVAASPGVIAVVQTIGIQRHEGPIPPGSTVINAAEVNPPAAAP